MRMLGSSRLLSASSVRVSFFLNEDTMDLLSCEVFSSSSGLEEDDFPYSDAELIFLI